MKNADRLILFEAATILRETTNDERVDANERKAAFFYAESLEAIGERWSRLVDPPPVRLYRREAGDGPRCVLCGEPVVGCGHNASPLSPIAGARCCDQCNAKVIDARRLDAKGGAL